MAVQILEVKRESWPAARLIGKKCAGSPNWGEWWANDWFTPLETQPRLTLNGDAYIGAVHIVDGMPERWIGMFFPVGAEAPEGYESVDIPPMDYAVCYLHGPENSPDFYTPAMHVQCLEALKAQHFIRKEDDWCFERCNCPRFTTPDAQGNVILDYGIAIENT